MIEVYSVSGAELQRPLRLLESSLRDGEPVRDDFLEQLRAAIQTRELEVFTARMDDEIVDVLVLSMRLNVSVGGRFGSVEELYVIPEARRRGVGRALLGAVENRHSALGTSYVEVQAVEDAAQAFYRALGFEIVADVKVMSRSYPI